MRSDFKHICDKHQPFSHGLVKMLNNTEESLYNAPIFWDIQFFGDQNFGVIFIKLYFHSVGDMEWFISM